MGKPISPQKRKYLNARAKGMSKKDAALAAGYSETVALSAKAHIETPDVRAAFAEIMREKAPARKIAQRIAEGLGATKTEFFQKDGVVTDRREVIAWNERRMYAALAAEYGGYFVPPKAEPIIDSHDINVQIVGFGVKDL
jgi:phage terminase small subunit